MCNATVVSHSKVISCDAGHTHEPIPLEDIADHVRTLHANDDYLFTEEYTVCPSQKNI